MSQVLNQKWKIILIALVTVGLLYFFEITGISSLRIFRFSVPFVLTNSFVNVAFQTIKNQTPYDSAIVLVQGPSCNGNDAMVGSIVSEISKMNPKVIAVDYDISDTALIGEFH